MPSAVSAVTLVGSHVSKFHSPDGLSSSSIRISRRSSLVLQVQDKPGGLSCENHQDKMETTVFEHLPPKSIFR
jgi:hypothetical protein